jgi:hypothetical protein
MTDLSTDIGILSFVETPFYNGFINKFNDIILGIDDPRHGKNIHYTLKDIIYNAFAIMYYQFSSIRSFEFNIKKHANFLALKNLPFVIEEIVSGNNMTKVLDGIDYKHFYELFYFLINKLNDAGKLIDHTINRKYLPIAIDGVETIKTKCQFCPSCNMKNHNNGTITGSHSLVGVAIVGSGKNLNPIPLPPAMIMKEKCQDKQGCETNTLKEYLIAEKENLHNLPFLKVLIMDALYTSNPMLRLIEELGFYYISIAKEGKNKYIYEMIEGIKTYKFTVERKIAGKNIYEFIIIEFYGNLPIIPGKSKRKVQQNDSGEEIVAPSFFKVQVVKYKKINNKFIKTNDKIFITDFVTNIELPYTVEEAIKIGLNKELSDFQNELIDLYIMARSRWDIENRVFNVEKNHGYHLTHKFGHGKEGRAIHVYSILNMLAFGLHNTIEILIPDIHSKLNIIDNKKTKWNSFIFLYIRFIELIMLESGFSDVEKFYYSFYKGNT